VSQWFLFWLPTLWGGCVLIFAGGLLVKENMRLAKVLVLLGCAGWLPAKRLDPRDARDADDTGDPHRPYPARGTVASPAVRDPGRSSGRTHGAWVQLRLWSNS
jgi:hypothetical protein